MDALKELGSMGTAHAATALSEMIQRKVTMPIPKVEWVKFANVTDFVGGPETVVLGIVVPLTGGIKGMMMYLMKLEAAHDVAASVLGVPHQGDPMEFSAMELSVIEELGNIMISSYLSPLAGLTNSKIESSIPYVSIDMANAILSVPAIEFGKSVDEVLFIESQIVIDDSSPSGCFIFVPHVESFTEVLKALGVE